MEINVSLLLSGYFYPDSSLLTPFSYLPSSLAKGGVTIGIIVTLLYLYYVAHRLLSRKKSVIIEKFPKKSFRHPGWGCLSGGLSLLPRHPLWQRISPRYAIGSKKR